MVEEAGLREIKQTALGHKASGSELACLTEMPAFPSTKLLPVTAHVSHLKGHPQWLIPFLIVSSDQAKSFISSTLLHHILYAFRCSKTEG